LLLSEEGIDFGYRVQNLPNSRKTRSMMLRFSHSRVVPSCLALYAVIENSSRMSYFDDPSIQNSAKECSNSVNHCGVCALDALGTCWIKTSGNQISFSV